MSQMYDGGEQRSSKDFSNIRSLSRHEQICLISLLFER